jgi:hypothetical protein
MESTPLSPDPQSRALVVLVHAYAQVFVEGATASMSGEMHSFVMSNIFPRIGRVRPTADVLAAIGAF